MTRTHLLLTITTVLGGSLLAESAFAFQNPHPGNPPVNVTIGRRPNGFNRACYLNTQNNTERFVDFGNAGGMTNSETALLSPNADFVIVVGGGVFQSRFACGETLTPVRHNGFNLGVQTLDGNDSGHCGGERSECLLGNGNDSMFAHSITGGRLMGQGGNDNLFGDSASSVDRLLGGTGNDCLDDTGNRHTTFDCADGSDRAVNRPADHISCEVNVTSC